MEEVNENSMLIKFPQRTVAFLEKKLEWFLPKQNMDHSGKPNLNLVSGPQAGNPTKIHCK